MPYPFNRQPQMGECNPNPANRLVQWGTLTFSPLPQQTNANKVSKIHFASDDQAMLSLWLRMVKNLVLRSQNVQLFSLASWLSCPGEQARFRRQLLWWMCYLLIRCNPLKPFFCSTERQVDNQEVKCSNHLCQPSLETLAVSLNDITVITRKNLCQASIWMNCSRSWSSDQTLPCRQSPICRQFIQATLFSTASKQ